MSVSPPRPSSGPAVLFVDDEPMIRELGRAVLEQAGFRVLTADDGDTGVEAFAAHRAGIGLVVLDVTMPRLTGAEAFRRIRMIDPAARVIFSTGFAAEDISSLPGALGVLPKPYRPAELLAAVRAAIPAD
jgi:DNA-binding response OmpR family regulator